MKVTIVKTGIANTASVVAGFARIGAATELTDDPTLVEAASHLVLPGVGAFAAGMEVLRSTGLDVLLKRRITEEKPTLCVCLGLQLLAESSEESPGEKGLGILPVSVRRFTGAIRIPQLGWNEVVPDAECRMLKRGYAYFANSFHLASPPDGWACAFTEHGTPFPAAIERGRVLGCQFHPELSGSWGSQLLQRWIEN